MDGDERAGRGREGEAHARAETRADAAVRAQDLPQADWRDPDRRQGGGGTVGRRGLLPGARRRHVLGLDRFRIRRRRDDAGAPEPMRS